MQLIGRIVPSLVLTLAVSACATMTRNPVTDVPAGTYVQVEPASDEFNAVAITDLAFAARMGDTTVTGQHWIDNEGRLRMTSDTGPCAGQESIWTYSYANNRVTLDLVEDRCPVRNPAFPQRMVYERS